MPATVTLKEIAQSVAPLDGREVTPVHTQLRNPLINRLLTPASVGAGRTSAARYSPTEAIRARLLVALQDLNFLAPEIEKINARLDQQLTSGAIAHPDSARVSGGFHYLDGLHSIIRGTQAGEDWRIVIVISRKANGERNVSAKIAWGDWLHGDRGLRAALALSDETLIGRIEIFASDLIRPLLPLLKG